MTRLGVIVSVLSVLALADRSMGQENVGARRIDWFDCQSRVGDLLHPRDCTRFIKCDSAGQAFEFDCLVCHNDPKRCTVVNRLVFNLTLDQCQWADLTDCETEVGGTVTPLEKDVFDCGDRKGNMAHPGECTKFIQCTASGKAFEHECGRCDNVPERCTSRNRLVYNRTLDKCLWANETECVDGEGFGGATVPNVGVGVALIIMLGIFAMPTWN